MLARSTLAVATAVAFLAPVSATQAAIPPTCPTTTSKGVEVTRMGRGLGCSRGLTLAVQTVRSRSGEYRGSGYYCRWGAGPGLGRVRIGRRTFYAGFCTRTTGAGEMAFYARRIKR